MPSSRRSRWVCLAGIVLALSCARTESTPRRASIEAPTVEAPRRVQPCSIPSGDVRELGGNPLATRARHALSCCGTEDEIALRHFDDGAERPTAAEAAADFRAARTRDPAFCEAFTREALALLELGRSTQAAALLEEAAALAPEDAAPVQNLAVLRAGLGDTRGAIRAFVRLLDFDHDAVVAEGHFGLAQVLAAVDLEAAIAHGKAADSIYRRIGSPLARDSAAVLGLLLSRQSCSKALPYLERSVALAVRVPEIDAHLGACLSVLGQAERAAGPLERARAAGVAIPEVANN